MNEEMYEEEDDDLPLQYRRLASHFHTGNPGFNDKLTAYLSTHVAMRSMVEQSVARSYSIYPNAPQFANQSIYPSPMLTPQTQQQPQPLPQAHNAAMYRQAPYPMPRPPQPNLPPGQRNRSASIATLPPRDLSGSTLNSPMVQSDESRRMSIPAVPTYTTTSSPIQIRTPTSGPSTAASPQRPTLPPESFHRHSYSYQAQQQQQQQPQPQQQPHNQPQSQYSSDDMSAFNNLSPFTTQLPAEAQGLLGSTLDYSDPFSSRMMVGSGNLPGNYYNFGNQSPLQTSNIGEQQTHPSLDGLRSTLAPSVLDTHLSVDYGQSSNFFNDALPDSKGVTPAEMSGDEGGWEFINDTWDDLPSSQNSP